ncbi:ABC transporter permease, partial [Candidatus Poribacteria bacterium]|nr:ABC transporter permease [Candidatus Poribacteria bacterium]
MRHQIYRRLLRQKSAVIGASILLFFILVAIFASLIATHEPREADVMRRLKGWSSEHYFGTDKVGRDIYSRVVYGSRISIQIGLVAMTFSISIGALLGMIAGYYGGWLDNAIMRLMDMML